MDYVFVKDSEGYVFKKLQSEVSSDEKIISEKEYMKISITNENWNNNLQIIYYSFEIVDIIKISTYIISMKFTVEKLSQAKAEIDSLEQFQKDMLEADYKKIQEQGIEFVRVKLIQKEIFEIKTNELRSLFKYAAGRIIVVGVVFVKKTKKTPKEKIKLAKQRLKEVWLWIMFL